ncbi:MAG: hypothetical protein MUF57_08485 [Gammaproteobacteria bacterium]|nr:hypothetical protein [Gammaproteobacteria bacterium]
MTPASVTGRLLLPRLVRLRDAPFYLGMDRNRFNAEVRPRLTELRIGTQGVAFDRLELHAWADDYVQRNGRPGQPIGGRLWDASDCQGSTCAVGSGTLTSEYEEAAFAKALAQATSPRRKRTSPAGSRRADRPGSSAFGPTGLSGRPQPGT